MEYLASTRAAGYNDVDRLALRHWVHLAEPRRTTLPRAHLRRGRGQWDRCRLRRTERYAQFDRGFDTIENKPTSPLLSPPFLATVSIASTRILPPPPLPRIPLSGAHAALLLLSRTLLLPSLHVPDRPRFRSRTCFHGFSNPVKFYSWPGATVFGRPFFISGFI